MSGTVPRPRRGRIGVIGLCLGLAAAANGDVPSHASSDHRSTRVWPTLALPPSGVSTRGVARVRRALLRGTVRLADGAVLETSELQNTTDPEVCGRVQSRRDLIVSETGRGIRNVIVAVTGIPEGAAVEPARLVLDNRNCQFEPHAAVATVGSTLITVNHDATLHTVHLYGARQENLALPVQGTSRSVLLESPGMITVLCDIHGWMRAYIRVDHHPFHAVTDANGRFRIPDVPAGTWELDVWHERLGRRTRTVRLDAGSIEEIVITYSPD